MNENGKIITDFSKMLEILHQCRNDKTVFEAVDPQENLFSLGLVEIETPSRSRAAVQFHKSEDPIPATFRPLQEGASEMRLECDYAFCFQYHGSVYSFNGRLLGADPKKFELNYRLESRLFRHQLRQFRRLHIDTLDRVSAEVGNRSYRLINVSLGGIGLIIDEPDVFQIGQKIPVTLVSENQTYQAEGSVRHVAPLCRDGFICGVSLTYDDESVLAHIRRFIDQTRQNRTHLCRINLLLR